MKTFTICKITYSDNSKKHLLRIFQDGIHFHDIKIHARQFNELKKCGIKEDNELKPQQNELKPQQ